MKTSRLEAFSDGVIAIIITIMVLDLKVPHDPESIALRPLLPVFASYVMSFVYVGIYWNNHHHLMYATERINGTVLWANLHLMFWLSLLPFATAWMRENEFAPFPTATYGFVLLLCAIAFRILLTTILRCPGVNDRLRTALGRDWKGTISVALYGAAIPLAFVHQIIALGIYALVALLWLVPDRRIEAMIDD
jgi:uncharacterized membrane protein